MINLNSNYWCEDSFSDNYNPKIEKLSRYAENWKTLPDAYRFATENPSLIQDLSYEQATDLYARISFYANITQGSHGISKEHCKTLLESLITQHPVFSQNPEESRRYLETESNNIIPNLFKSGEYHEQNKRLGIRYLGSGLESQFSPKTKTEEISPYDSEEEIIMSKNIKEIAKEWIA